MNQSQRMIESLQPMREGTNTEVFFDPEAAQLLANVLASPVTVAERHLVGMILSDDQIADTIMSWPQDEDIRPVVIERLAGWLDEGPGPWKHPWDEGAQMIIEDLAAVAKAVSKILKKFDIKRKVQWNKLIQGNVDKAFDRAIARVAKMASKDFQVNDKGARRFISQLADVKMEVAKIG
jgi:hypothetical protein